MRQVVTGRPDSSSTLLASHTANQADRCPFSPLPSKRWRRAVTARRVTAPAAARMRSRSQGVPFRATFSTLRPLDQPLTAARIDRCSRRTRGHGGALPPVGLLRSLRTAKVVVLHFLVARHMVPVHSRVGEFHPPPVADDGGHL
jgi:hypothetical protein